MKAFLAKSQSLFRQIINKQLRLDEGRCNEHYKTEPLEVRLVLRAVPAKLSTATVLYQFDQPLLFKPNTQHMAEKFTFSGKKW